MSTANTRQVGGSHYAGAYQHWDFVLDSGMGYLEAQITRYIDRHEKKKGREDVEKALHYAEKLLEARREGRVEQNWNLVRVESASERYFGSRPTQHLADRVIIEMTLSWRDEDDLLALISAIRERMIQAYGG